MLKPTIITHRRPHLDEICAIWIIQKYWPQFSDVEIEFINTSPTGGDIWNDIPPDTHPLVIYIGVGHGMFDEHKGDTTESAASLVWQETQRKFKIPKGFKDAINRIVKYVKQEDMAAFLSVKNHEFSIPTILSGVYGFNKRDNQKVYEVGMNIMDALMFEMLKVISAEKDWEGREDLETPWGKAAAIITDIPGIERIAYREGYAMVITHNQAKTYAGFRADPNSDVDLTNAAMKVKQLEPNASWFLHQSKRMLLCGGEIAEGGEYSDLTLEQLASLVRS